MGIIVIWKLRILYQFFSTEKTIFLSPNNAWIAIENTTNFINFITSLKSFLNTRMKMFIYIET